MEILLRLNLMCMPDERNLRSGDCLPEFPTEFPYRSQFTDSGPQTKRRHSFKKKTCNIPTWLYYKISWTFPRELRGCLPGCRCAEERRVPDLGVILNTSGHLCMWTYSFSCIQMSSLVRNNVVCASQASQYPEFLGNPLIRWWVMGF